MPSPQPECFLTGREPACCFERGAEQVKSVVTVSVQTKLALETEDTSSSHKEKRFKQQMPPWDTPHKSHHHPGWPTEQSPTHSSRAQSGSSHRTWQHIHNPLPASHSEVTLKTFPFPVPRRSEPPKHQTKPKASPALSEAALTLLVCPAQGAAGTGGGNGSKEKLSTCRTRESD